MESSRPFPPIRENYKRHTPPTWVRPTVERLLRSLAPEHIGGLEAVVLTDSASIGKGKTQRVGKRKHLRNKCRGFYHPRSNSTGGAWIEVILDNVVPGTVPRPLLWFQLGRDFLLAETLYHEVGHHLEDSVGAAKRRGEAAADDWCRRLTRRHMRKNYWYLIPVVRVLRRVVKFIRHK
jgi:hypothetical protein